MKEYFKNQKRSITPHLMMNFLPTHALNLSYEGFTKWLGEFNLSYALRALSYFETQYYYTEKRDAKVEAYIEMLGNYFRSLLFKFIMLYGNPTNGKRMQPHDFFLSCDYVSKLYNSVVMEKLLEPSSGEFPEGLLTSIINKSNFYREDEMELNIWRYFNIFHVIDNTISNIVSEYLGSPEGFTYPKLIMINFVVSLALGGIVEINTGSKLFKAYVDTFGTSLQGFKKVFDETNDSADNHMSVRSVERAPIIIRGADLHIPVRLLAVNRCTTNLYDDLFKVDRSFGDKFGKAFQKYVYELIKETHVNNPKIKIYDLDEEREILRFNDRDMIADYALLYKSLCLIIEVKSRRLPKEYIEQGLRSRKYENTIKEYARSLEQCENTKKNMTKVFTDLGIPVNRCIFLVIILEKSRGENSQEIRIAIEKIFKPSCEYHFMAVNEFELYSRRIKQSGLPKLTRDKGKKGFYNDPFEVFFHDQFSRGKESILESINDGLKEMEEENFELAKAEITKIENKS